MQVSQGYRLRMKNKGQSGLKAEVENEGKSVS